MATRDKPAIADDRPDAGSFLRGISIARRLILIMGIAVVGSIAPILLDFLTEQHESEITALAEAEQTAITIAVSIAEIDRSSGDPAVAFDDLQTVIKLIQSLHSQNRRDIVIVDKNKRIVADAIPANIGRLFDHDSDNEIGRTLRDGARRTFIERSTDYPEGIHQVVVPIRTVQNDIIGVLLLDYEGRLRQIQTETWESAAKQAGLVLLVLSVMLLTGYRIIRSVVNALRELVNAAAQISGGDIATPIRRMSQDEIGNVAEAMENMRLNLRQVQNNLHAEMAQKERQNREIGLRNEMGELLQSCYGIEEAGTVIARFMPQLFDGASGAIYLATPGAETLAAVAHWGEAAADSIAMSDCWALRRGKTHLVTDADTSLLCAHVGGTLAGASVCVPLAAHGETLGLLHMTCPSACEPGSATMAEKQQLAEALAAQVGMALGNLRLRETLRQQSIRDALTGLYNRRYLEDAAPRELSRAQRAGQTLAAFMLDVDHFKKFNDDYGHEAGDAVLRALGKALHDNCRQGDSACRFGGEEFTVLLPDTSLAQAREWGERLMGRVRAMEVKSGGTALPRIAISMGLALYPEHGNDAETLLQAADLALYDAKHAGRDRQMVYGENAAAKAGE